MVKHQQSSSRRGPQTREPPESEAPRAHDDEAIERHGPREPEFPERDRHEHHPEADERTRAEGDDSDVERGRDEGYDSDVERGLG